MEKAEQREQKHLLLQQFFLTPLGSIRRESPPPLLMRGEAGEVAKAARGLPPRHEVQQDIGGTIPHLIQARRATL